MRYALGRGILLIPKLLGILLGLFLMLHLAPGGPIDALLGENLQYTPADQVETIRKAWGLDRPLFEQYLTYVGRVARGDLGESFATHVSVAVNIQKNIMPTFYLALAGMCLAVLIGLPAGIVAALKRNTLAEYVTLTLATVGLSAPSFLIGIVLLYVFAFSLKWFPIFGDGGTSLGPVLLHLVLPAVVVGVGVGALLARLARSAILETISQDYVRTAEAKGLPGMVVVLKHVLRNAMVPLVASASTMFAYLLTGSVVVEIVFSRRGLGSLMVSSINGRDFPLAQGVVLVYGTIIVAVNFFADALLGILDPRITYR